MSKMFPETESQEEGKGHKNHIVEHFFLLHVVAMCGSVITVLQCLGLWRTLLNCPALPPLSPMKPSNEVRGIDIEMVFLNN